MKYLLMMLAEPDAFAKMTAADQAAFDTATRAFDEKLMAEQVYLGAEALFGTERAKTIRRRGPKTNQMDGPFAETKECLCGYILIDVASEEQAVALAAESPFAELGAVEVRPVMQFD